VIARELPTQYVGQSLLSAAFDPDFAVEPRHKSYTKKTTLIAERGLLLIHSTAEHSPYAAATFSSAATV